MVVSFLIHFVITTIHFIKEHLYQNLLLITRKLFCCLYQLYKLVVSQVKICDWTILNIIIIFSRRGFNYALRCCLSCMAGASIFFFGYWRFLLTFLFVCPTSIGSWWEHLNCWRFEKTIFFPWIITHVFHFTTRTCLYRWRNIPRPCFYR